MSAESSPQCWQSRDMVSKWQGWYMFAKWQGWFPWSNKRIYKLLRHRSLISSGWFLSQGPSKSRRREEGRRWHCDVVVQHHGQVPWSNRWFPEDGPVDSKEGWTETRRLCKINRRCPWLDEEQRWQACRPRCSRHTISWARFQFLDSVKKVDWMMLMTLWYVCEMARMIPMIQQKNLQAASP